MTTVDYSNTLMHDSNEPEHFDYDQYVLENGFSLSQSASAFASGVTSPNASPSIDPSEFTRLMQTFTHGSYPPIDDATMSSGQFLGQNFVNGDDTASSTYYPSQQNSPTSTFDGQYGIDAQPNMQFVNGLNIHPSHFGNYIHTHSNAPSPTVTNLEEAAANAAPSAYAQQPFQAMRQSQTGFSTKPMRSSTFDGSRQFAELSLSSPRNSISASSSASSNQNSPTTPLSTYSNDGSTFSVQQQQHMPKHAYYQAQEQPPSNPLSASVPASLGHSHQFTGQPTHHTNHVHPHQTNTASGVSHSSLNRARSRSMLSGLMEEVVSGRRVVPSPMTDAGMDARSDTSERTSSSSSSKEDGKAGRRKSTRKSATPPHTPGRSALRASRSGAVPLSVATNLGTPTKDPYGQTPSSAGPHRTPSKRIQAMQVGGLDTILGGSTPSPAPSAAGAVSGGTPTRPDLRRTISHTPRSSDKMAGNPAQSAPYLGSPAQMARTPSSTNMLSMSVGSSQRARITTEGQLDFGAALPTANGTASSSGLLRTRSSPGLALKSGGLTFPKSANAQAPEAISSFLTTSRSRRSSTLSGLQMSPLSATATEMPFAHGTASLTPSPVPAVSFADVVNHLDSVLTFLEYQGQTLDPAHPPQAHLALGTQDQLEYLKDMRRRIVTKAGSQARM